MAAEFELTDREVIIHVQGWDAVRAGRITVKVPFTHIVSVSVGMGPVVVAEPSLFWGSHSVGHLAVGYAEARNGVPEVFYLVRNGARALAIELRNDRFGWLLVEPKEGVDPRDVARQILAAVPHASPTPSPDNPIFRDERMKNMVLRVV